MLLEGPGNVLEQRLQGLLRHHFHERVQIGLAMHGSPGMLSDGNHRHVEVNGRTVDVPSFRVSAGDEIAIRTKSKDILPIEASLEARTRPALPEWLALDEKARVGRVVRAPMRSDISFPIQEQLIVELYSK